MKSGVLLILTGPTGAGKDAVMGELLKRFGWNRVVTYTTRPPRMNEVDGVDYHFVSEEKFQELASGVLLEKNENAWAKYSYGTAKKDLERVLCGDVLIWRIDPVAGVTFREKIASGFAPDLKTAEEIIRRTVVVYVTMKSWADIEERVTKRGGSDYQSRPLRLAEEKSDWLKYREFLEKHAVFNEDGKLDEAVEEIRKRVEKLL